MRILKSLSIIVHGKVQGVGFRYFALQLALENEITGWVKNMDDGSVEIEAVGDEHQLEKFIFNLEKGNRFTKVENLQINDITVKKRHKSFKVKY